MKSVFVGGLALVVALPSFAKDHQAGWRIHACDRSGDFLGIWWATSD